MTRYIVLDHRQVDRGRGIALVICGGLMVLLTQVLPIMAPVAALAFGVYRLVKRSWSEGLIFVGAGVVLWFLSGFFGWILWLIAAMMVGGGLFLIFRSLSSSRRRGTDVL